MSASTFLQKKVYCLLFANKFRKWSTPFQFLKIQIKITHFFQLPPVENELYGDSGKHCFQTTFFDQVFPHKINLHIIYRQNERDLIIAVNELEQGKVSDATLAVMHSLNRPLPEFVSEEEAVHLFCRNADADIHNYNVIANKQGNLVTFSSDSLLKILVTVIICQKCWHQNIWDLRLG